MYIEYLFLFLFFFKQKTAYEMRISDWSSDVCSSDLLHSEDYIHALGAMTGKQAMQMVRAGLQAIYLSGWQVAADANTAGAKYPEQSLYPDDAGPALYRRINNTLQRADQIEHQEGKNGRAHVWTPANNAEVKS